MFKKLMAMMKSPKNHGGQGPKLGEHRWVKSYDVILSNMEGSPSYPLSHQLTIGSEIGNIIIKDPSVSPRHATILLQEEVISIIDHGSVAGTFVNGTKIPPGKFIILEDTDKVMTGDLEVKLAVKTNVVDNTGFVPPGHDHLEDEVEEEDEESELEEEIQEEDEEGEDEEGEAGPEETITKSKVYGGKPGSSPAPLGKKKKKKKISFSLPSYNATNSIVRVMALSADLLLSFIILIVFLPFDDFRNFIFSLPVLIAETLDFSWENIWILATEEAGAVTDIAKDVYEMANELVPVYPLVLIFFLVRLVSTIIFGVSISEFFFGVRANFNGIWARIGGIFRVIIGMITGPFLIFDLPAVASKRTFKEFITLTNTYVGSRIVLFFGIVFYFPLLLILLLISPMVVGLELIEPIPFTANVSQRVKTKPQPVEGEAQVIQNTTEGSRHLGLSLSYDPQQISIIPSFRFKGERSKLNMKASIEVFHKEGERSVTVELFKIFDMKELMMIGLKGNFLLHDKYQQIYNYAFSPQNTNRFFKLPENIRLEEMYGKQVVAFTEMAFGLSIDTLPDFMMGTTPFIKSIVDYRSSLLGLFEYKDFTDASVIKLGKILCLRMTYDTQKPFDLIMPLIRGEGRIFKITYDRKTDLASFRNKLYKFTLNELTWGIPDERENIETFKALEVVDVFTSDLEKSVITAQKAQALYGYYFEKSAEVMKVGNLAEFEIWKTAVQNMMTMIPHLRQQVAAAPAPMEELPAETTETTDVSEDIKGKLRSNFSDLFNALENKNKSFFGIEEVPTV